jgi:hypothetical protein
MFIGRRLGRHERIWIQISTGRRGVALRRHERVWCEGGAHLLDRVVSGLEFLKRSGGRDAFLLRVSIHLRLARDLRLRRGGRRSRSSRAVVAVGH